ncbi:hypothetical protein EWM64_g10053, partial [Hericium alpestre]
MSRVELPHVDHLDLDPSLYNLKGDEVAFYKQQTGIQDDEELKRHIIEIQTGAYAVGASFSPVASFRLTYALNLDIPISLCQKLSLHEISRLPAYPQALKLGKERPGAILFDIGCCFGNDVYKAVADSYPAENVVTSDLYQ